MESTHRIVVVGAGYAGVLAAARASRKWQGRPAEVVLVSPGDTLVERVRLHEAVARGRSVEQSLDTLLATTGVRVVKGSVIHVAADERAVILEGAALGYDRLILAVGSATARAEVPGVAQHAFSVDPPQLPRLRRALQDAAPQQGRVAICGSGLTGVELAAELAEAFPSLRLTLFSAGPVAPSLSQRGRTHVERSLHQHRVALRDRTKVLEIRERLLLTDRGDEPFDVCIWTGGFAAPPLARDCGLATDRHGRAYVDAHLCALGHDDIYVVGDACAARSHGRTVPMGCKTAPPMAVHAVDNAYAASRGRAPKAFVFGDAGVCVSLGRSNGVLQRLTRAGEPIESIITGRPAAWLKERLCRYPLWRIALETRRRRPFTQGLRSSPARLPNAMAR